MEKKKIFTIFILIAVLVIILYACSEDKPAEQNNTSGGSESGKSSEPTEQTGTSGTVPLLPELNVKTDEHITLTLNKTTTYQKVEGFGFAHGLGGSEWYDKIINDMGLTMWRTDISPDIPADANWADRRDEILALKETADAAGVELRVLLTVWSPPGDFKVKLPDNYMELSLKQLNAERDKKIPQVTSSNGGTLNPDRYKDYAEWLISALDMYKSRFIRKKA